MKAVILCGGKGTRLREETEYKPKPMVTIGKMALLWHIMKIYSYYGINDFILCLGYKGEMIKDYFLNFETWSNDFTLKLRCKPDEKIIHHNQECLEDWNITFADTGQDSMTGSRVAQIKKYLGGIGEDEDFFVTYGDGVSDIDIKKLYEFHKEKGRIATLTGVHPASHYGVLETDGDIVKSFKEKPRLDGMVSGGFFVFNKKVFDYLSEDKNCVLEDEPLKRLAINNQLAVYQHGGFWYSVDTYKQYEELSKMCEDGNMPWKVWV